MGLVPGPNLGFIQGAGSRTVNREAARLAESFLGLGSAGKQVASVINQKPNFL